jgi:hypothetical protein
MNTRLIISAEDRGATRLLRKMGTEADSAVDKFGQLGTSITAAIGGFTAGYGVKKALGWIDEYKTDVMSVAVMLTDTMRGSGKEIGKVFQQNTIHAEEFFKVLRIQSMKSMSTFEDLRSAYAIFTSKGLALEATQQQAKVLADLVDRISLATRGMNQNVQVPQELRAILQGTARPVDTVAKMFIERDANFQQTIKRLVSQGDGAKVMEYMGSLLADIPIESAITQMLKKALSNVKTSVQSWALEAFSPLYDELTGILQKMATELYAGDAPFLKGIEALVKQLTSAVKVTAEFFGNFARSDFGKFLMTAAPQLLAVATAATVAARAFGLLKAAAMASMTGVGAAAMATGALVVGNTWSQSQQTREQAVKATGGNDWNEARSYLADLVQSFVAFAKGVATALGNTISEITSYIGQVIERNLIPTLQAIFYSVQSAILNAGAKAVEVFNGIYKIFERVLSGFQVYWEGIKLAVNTGIVSFLNLFRGIETFGIGDRVASIIAGRQGDIGKNYENLAKYTSEFLNPKGNDTLAALAGSYSESASEAATKRDAAFSRMQENPSFLGMLSNIKDAFGKGITEMLDSWDAGQKARRGLGNVAGASAVLDTSAIVGTGSSQKAAADIEKELKEYQKNLAKLAKASAGLDAVMAQLESATLKGGDSLEYALSQVSKEYANYKAKIAKLAGGQDVMSEIDSRIVTEKNLQAELEKKIKDAKDEELALLQKQLAESKSKMAGLYSKAQIDLTAQVQKKQLDALKLAEQFYTEQRRIRTVAEADKLSDKVFNIQGMLAGVGGRGELSDFSNQKKFEALEIQKQLSDLHRDNDLFGGSESEIQAQERINGLKAQYLELYRQTSEAMEIQRAKAEYMASLAEENTIASGFMAGMQDIADGVTSTFTHIRTLTVDTFTSMQSTMSNVFFDFFSGELDSAKDYFAAFGQSILQAFSDMLAKMLAEYITTTMTMKSIGGMLSGIFGALGGFAWGATTTQLGGVSAGQAVTLTAANGGVFPGGFQKFASGGIINQPTLGLVGEGRYNEAVVPLPDGRSIPVNMRGGGTSVVVNVIDNTGGEVKKSVNKEMDEQGNMVIDIVLDALARNRKGARSQFKTALGVA